MTLAILKKEYYMLELSWDNNYNHICWTGMQFERPYLYVNLLNDNIQFQF